MYLRFYLDENNRRVYTLKKTTPAGLDTQSAHPARFSPEDKNSKYRIIIKKRFGLLPTQQSKQYFNNFIFHFIMLLWEWRRIFRQKIRSLSGKSTLTYQQWSRRRLFLSFVLFFVGWKAIGYTLNDMLLWTTDEETGIGRFLSPKEARERKIAAEKSLPERFLPQQPSQTYALDD